MDVKNCDKHDSSESAEVATSGIKNTNSPAIFHYHNRTKHQANAYAKAPEFLDWDEQPNPFRRFSGCETVELPLLKTELSCLFDDTIQRSNQ